MKTNNNARHMIARATKRVANDNREALAVSLALQFWKSANIRLQTAGITGASLRSRYPNYFSPFDYPPSQ